MAFRSLPRLSWRRFLASALALPVLVCPAQFAPAQTFDATNLREPTDLGAVWLVRAGDDPAYARAEFDDSRWTPFDPKKSIVSLFPNSRPDVLWYRLRVKVNPGQTGLALKEQSISSAFEIYVNGQRIIASGQVSPFRPCTSNARLLEPIPDRLPASGSLLIAMRVHITANEWMSGQNPGFYASNLTLGQRNTLYRDDWLAILGENAFYWVDELLLIGLGLVALVLFAAQPGESEYLWIFAVGALTLAEAVFPFVSVFHNISSTWEFLSGLPRLASPYIWVSLYFSFVHQRMGWRWRAILIFAGLANYFSGIGSLLFVMPLWLQLFGNLPFIFLLSVVIPIVLAVHLRRGNREAGILLIPVVLLSLYIYARIVLIIMFELPGWRSLAMKGFFLVDRIPAGPFIVSLNNVSGMLSTLSLAIIMLLRSIGMSRRQAQLEGELAAAREVQQIILPEQADTVPGFAVESIYQPAQQVGGDFFQILPAGEGGLLVVLGDVAGKGLPAAMLVSVLVGAIRGVAGYTHNPSEMLAGLNERLVGRAGGGFSTALAAHIGADGAVTIANAGHLSPYLDGREIELPGALPLGIQTQTHYETSRFYLAPGSRLVFYSDGVIEARNPQGELFGFERGREMAGEPAAAIAEAARQFGQQDDITVVTIERAAAIANAA